MIYNINFDISSIIISTLSIVCVLITKDIKRKENKVFLSLVINGLISGVFDVASSIAISYPESVPYFVLSGLSFVFLLVHNLVAIQFYLYMRVISGSPIKWRKYSDLPAFSAYMIPAGINVLVMLLNPIFHWVYYFDDALVYHHGPMMYWLYISSFIYIIMALILIVHYKVALQRKRIILLTAFVFSGIFTIVFQFFLPYILIELFVQSVVYLGILVSISDEDATYDLVTRVYNRKTFLEDTQVRMDGGRRFDIIILKLLNLDYYRSMIGLEAVNEVTYEIAHWLDSLDRAAKVYDLESGIFAFRTDTDDEVLTEALLDILNEQFQLDWMHNELAIQFNVQIAVVHIPDDVNTMESLVSLIDRQYISAGRTKILDANEFDAYKREAAVEAAVKRAIDNRTFKVHYQPIWDSHTGKIHSAEALIRLIDDKMGFISPEEFIKIAERNGTIMRIGEIVFEEVCRFIRDTDIEKLGMEFVEVNLSTVQCMMHDLDDYIMGVIHEYGVDPTQINLEITESAAVLSEEMLKNTMASLRRQGLTFSMDDFGTGYSNLSNSFSLQYDIVKIDKSILWAADEDYAARILLESTIQMIKGMDRRIVVEGVETKEHRDILKHLGVDFCQGYYFSKALPEDAFVKYVKDFNKIGD